MNSEKEREAFKAWFKKEYLGIDNLANQGDEGAITRRDYADVGWKAAKAQVVPSKLDEINNWAKWHIEDYQISESTEHDRGWYNACCAVINMLEAQEQNQ